MTVQQIIKPSEIESQLKATWDHLAKDKKMMKACLFNLIVYTKVSERTDYFRTIVQHVIEKFPCRIIFISADTHTDQAYLKTGVSIINVGEKDSPIACDNIDIAVAGQDYQRVPFIILPHLIPDLPVYLLWAEDPCVENPLFSQIEKLATRIIFDSEASENLEKFATAVLNYEKKMHPNIADLNWARTENWRDLIAATFYSSNRLEKLRTAEKIEICYNTQQSEFFSHVKMQSLYLQAWLGSRLGWKNTTTQSNQKKESLVYETSSGPLTVELIPNTRSDVKAGAILSVKVCARNREVFNLFRNPDEPSHICVEVSSEEKCELPHHFIVPKSAYGQSLVKEITYHNTSQHFLLALTHLIENNQAHD